MTAAATVPLVGRGSELAVGAAVLDGAARRGVGGIVLVEGEAGIGKTRLAAELVADARRRGFAVLSGAADELGADRPFGPLLDALGDRLAPATTATTAATTASAPAGDLGFTVAEAIVEAVEELAATGPVLLYLDDVQWADPSTVRALLALARVVDSIPLVILLTARAFPRTPTLDAAVDELAARGAHRLALAGLDAAHAAALATAAAVAAGAPPTSTAAAAGGNPLLIIELARAAGPSTLQAAVRRRLRSLPAETVEVLKIASVLGRRFHLDHLAAVTDRRPAALTPLLEDALAAGVLGEEDGELAFRHDLIRDAVYLDLAEPLRRGLHRDAARMLGARGYPALAVAEHLVAGAGPGDAEAVAWLAEAAAAAAPRAPQVAVRLLEHARGLAAADAPSARSDELAADLVPLLVQVGRAADASALSRRVLASGPSPRVEAMLRRGAGEVLWARGWVEPAVAELEGAGAVPGAPEDVRAEALALACYLRCFLGAPGGEGRPDAHGGGGDFAACAVLKSEAMAAAAEGRATEAVELAQGAVAIAARSTDARIGILHPHLVLGLTLLDADRFDDAERALQEGRRRAEERGAVAWLPLYHAVLAMREVLSGSWDDALADIEAGLALAEEVGTRLYTPFLLGMAAWVAVQRDELDTAQEAMERAVGEFLAATTPAWQAEAAQGVAAATSRWPLEWGLWVNAALAEARQSPAQALTDLQAAWAVAAPLRYFLGYRLFGPDLVRLAVAAGELGLAAEVTAEVAEGARRSGIAGAAAAAQRCQGLLDGDPAVLGAAADALTATPRAIEAATADEQAGAALAGAGGRDNEAEAVRRLERARGFYEAARSVRGLARVDAALRSLGVRHRPRAHRTATTGWDSLTPTERRVADLAGDGLTNRQIGERLFVSPRTVETHLGHAFAKLGVATRAQLAAEAARRRHP